MNQLSNLEITIKLVGLASSILGILLIIYSTFLLSNDLAVYRSKYFLANGIVFGLFLCYLGYVSLRFRQRETGLYIYEYDAVE